MTKKQPTPIPATDEWGIYDPAKAGMQALYSRLGRPVLRASAKSERLARRRAGKADRPADGVGLAIEEAKRRAGILAAGPVAPPGPAPAETAPPAPAPVVTAAPVAPAPVLPATKTTRAVRAKTSTGSKRKLAAAVSAAGARLDAANARRTAAVARPAATPTPAPEPIPEPAPAPAPPVSAPAPRRAAARKTARSKPAVEADVVKAPAVPSPSPRRPRGPVPLAAWAHAVNDTSRPEPKRSEGKGLWRGIFRIPSEVALVEYARGCRIHRLVIEASSAPLDDLL